MKNQNTTAVQSVLRTEEKYLLSHPQALTLQNKLRALLHVDDFGDNDGYRVRSLYFDSFHNIDYREKNAGTYHRKKIRLRIYDEKQVNAKLELKEKHGALQHKVSVTISRQCYSNLNHTSAAHTTPPVTGVLPLCTRLRRVRRNNPPWRSL